MFLHSQCSKCRTTHIRGFSQPAHLSASGGDPGGEPGQPVYGQSPAQPAESAIRNEHAASACASTRESFKSRHNDNGERNPKDTTHDEETNDVTVNNELIEPTDNSSKSIVFNYSNIYLSEPM